MELKLKDLKTFTWEEVQKHNRREDCWVVLEKEVDGRKKGLVLDVTEWAPNHPGGTILYDGAGGDCTIMFWSYHPLSFIDNCNSYFNKMVIGEVENYKCVYEVGSAFHRTLKQRVEAKVTRAERCSDWRMWAKSVCIVVAFVLSFWYGWIGGNLWATILYGFLISQSGLNMMHDGVHCAYSRSETLNALVSFSFNLAGANYLAYRRAHAFGHHAYTNHLEYDTGITGSFPILRLHDRLGTRWFHKLQHVYVLPLYLFSIVLFWLDWEDMTTFYNYPKRKGPAAPLQWVCTILGKLMFVAWFFGHFYMVEWRRALLDCIIVAIEMGFCALVFFVVNHWTEKAALITNQELINHTSDWAVLQILCSTNFSIDSKFWLHLSGALNLQIEHHLFPTIIHTRLPDVQPIVRATCLEYGLRYDDQIYPSFWSALASNFVFIKNLGNNIPKGGFPAIGKRKHA